MELLITKCRRLNCNLNINGECRTIKQETVLKNGSKHRLNLEKCPFYKKKEKTISFSLSQEQTLALPNTDLLVQVNWTYLSGAELKRAASNQVTINFMKNLKEEVMA